MKPFDEQAITESLRRNPFWPCFFVFALLATDYAIRLSKSYTQREQMQQARLNQAQTIGRMNQALSQQAQAETKLQALSLDLVKSAGTNAAAAQIVREFNIQWTPPPQTPATTNSPAPEKK